MVCIRGYNGGKISNENKSGAPQTARGCVGFGGMFLVYIVETKIKNIDPVGVCVINGNGENEIAAVNKTGHRGRGAVHKSLHVSFAVLAL